MRRQLWVGVFALAAAAVMAAPAPARADDCDECKEQCDKEEEKCKEAGGPLCRGRNNPICEMFKNFQCPMAGKVCRDIRCGTLPGCGGGSNPSGGGQVSGDPHFYSLDRSAFDYQGAGEYVVARSKDADIEVQARFVAQGTRVSLAGMAAVRTGGHVVIFEPGADVTVDGDPVEVGTDGLFIEPSIGLFPWQTTGYVLATGESRMWVQVSATHLNLFVDPDPKTARSWEGLLGNFDGKPDNDFTTRAGETLARADMTKQDLYDKFGDSWRVSQDESFLRYGKGETTETHTNRDHPASHPTIADLDEDTFAKARATCLAKGVRRGEPLRNCIYDVGLTGSAEFADAYALARSVEAAARLAFSAKFGMRVQRTGYQGEEIPVFWSGSVTDQGALAIIDAEGKRIVHRNTKGTQPTMIRLPAEPGSYKLEFTQGESSTSADIDVTAATATLTVPDTVGGAMEFDVTWTGPLGHGDYIGLMKQGETDPHRHLAYVWAHRPASPTFQAPADPGTYEIWYVLQGGSKRTAIAKKSFEVTEPRATVSPPKTAEVGDFVPVPWTGPNGKSDFVDIVPTTETGTHEHLHYAWARSAKDASARLRAPANPGTYSVRYIAHTSAGRAVLATQNIKVTDVKVKLTAPKSVAPSASFEMSWTGPNRPHDYVAITQAGETNPQTHIAYQWATQMGRRAWTAPADAGTYDVVYVLQGGDERRIVARKTLVVKAP